MRGRIPAIDSLRGVDLLSAARAPAQSLYITAFCDEIGCGAVWVPQTNQNIQPRGLRRNRFAREATRGAVVDSDGLSGKGLGGPAQSVQVRMGGNPAKLKPEDL